MTDLPVILCFSGSGELSKELPDALMRVLHDAYGVGVSALYDPLAVNAVEVATHVARLDPVAVVVTWECAQLARLLLLPDTVDPPDCWQVRCGVGGTPVIERLELSENGETVQPVLPAPPRRPNRFLHRHA